MPTKSIVERLKEGDVLVMDGATGSEARRRGADTFRGYNGPLSSEELQSDSQTRGVHDENLGADDPVVRRQVAEENLKRLGPWSAPLNLDAPDIVRGVHQDYLRAGAEVIISNNFFTSRSKLARIGAGDDWETYARAGARLAIEARDAVNPEAYVAGGFAPPAEADIRTEFHEEAALLAEEGVDFLLPEYLGAIDECVAAAEACADAGLPVVLGIRHITPEGNMQYDETFADLITALGDRPFAGILLMCSDPANIAAGLKNLRAAYAGPIGAYPHPPGWLGGANDARQDEDVQQFVGFADEWLALGAQVVGGCCGSSPAHIAGVAPHVKAAA